MKVGQHYYSKDVPFRSSKSLESLAQAKNSVAKYKAQRRNEGNYRAGESFKMKEGKKEKKIMRACRRICRANRAAKP